MISSMKFGDEHPQISANLVWTEGVQGFDPYSDLKISALVRCCQREPSLCLSGMLMALSRAIGYSKIPLVLLNTPNYGYNLVKFRIHPIIMNWDCKFRMHPISKQTAVNLTNLEMSLLFSVWTDRESRCKCIGWDVMSYQLFLRPRCSFPTILISQNTDPHWSKVCWYMRPLA